ncbi:NAD(P)H-flavin reductase [Ferrimonas gelatinilytica]|uniref:NAD(P)H-flavin reductase n=1 Tax=Ferrimonas gelatinilytica TaxID=1255257 RepID=A0ABP9RVA7_9GAMM
MSRISCQVVSVTPFNDTVYRAILKPAAPLAYRPGQYLTIVMSEQDKRPFSIASAPGGDTLELHIGAAVAEGYAMQVVDRLNSEAQIEIEAPFGDAYLRPDSSRPRVLIAGGTGFSYVNSMMEWLIQQGDSQTTFLYWGSRDPQSMYLREAAERWQAQHPALTFVPVFDHPVAGARQGTVIDAVCADFISLLDYDVYIAGRFEMAGAARERFRQHGIDEAHLFGDAYAFMK